MEAHQTVGGLFIDDRALKFPDFERMVVLKNNMEKPSLSVDLFTLLVCTLAYDVRKRPVGSHSTSERPGCSCLPIVVNSFASMKIISPPGTALNRSMTSD